MNKTLAFAALAEALTGAVMLVVPSVVGRLLLGTELSGVSVVIGRVTGIALVALGVACWPRFTPLCGMVTYSLLVTLYLALLGFRGEYMGMLLWPAVGLHAVLTILLARAWLTERKTRLGRDDS